MEVLINFATIKSRRQLISVLSPIWDTTDDVVLKIKLNADWMEGELLVLLVCFRSYLVSNGVKVKCELVDFIWDNNVSRYASRINFFRLLDIEVGESFARHNSSGRFIEILSFTKDSAVSRHNDLTEILYANGVNTDMLVVLRTCLWEIVDNTLNHSKGDFELGGGSGFIYAQFFPRKNKVKITIADHGVGIHYALTQHPRSEYKALSESDAVRRSIERGVTNSTGMGFGLWSTAEMMRMNMGELYIHSGLSALICSEKETMVSEGKWKGTITSLVINLLNPVNHRAIYGQDSARDEELTDFLMERLGISENLW